MKNSLNSQLYCLKRLDTFRNSMAKRGWGAPYSQERIAVDTLGGMRAKEAVPILLECLGKITIRTEVGPDIVERALMQIGMPARDHLVELVIKDPDRKGVSALSILVGIMGKEGAILTLGLEAEKRDLPDELEALRQGALRISKGIPE